MIGHHLVDIYTYTFAYYMPIRPKKDNRIKCVIMCMQLISV